MDCQLEGVSLSILISFLFIAALYIYPNKLSRDDSFTIKTRFCCVCLTTLISLYILNQHNKFGLETLQIHYLLDRDFLVNGLLKPLVILFVIQFIPILMLVQNVMEDGFDSSHCELNIIVVRNYIFAPILEEVNYRYVILQLLYPCFSKLSSCLISSFLFGLSHFHHYVLDVNPTRSLMSTCCQFGFTFLFGIFASSMYFKSTYIITPIILHAICNYLCVPDFESISSNKLLLVSTIATFSLGIYLMVVL